MHDDEKTKTNSEESSGHKKSSSNFDLSFAKQEGSTDNQESSNIFQNSSSKALKEITFDSSQEFFRNPQISSIQEEKSTNNNISENLFALDAPSVVNSVCFKKRILTAFSWKK